MKGFTLDYLRQLPAGLSEDHPVFQYKPWPRLVTRWWVYDMYHRYGDDSPVWQSRVCGQFPTQAEDSLYPIAWLERAKMGSFLADRWPDVTTRNVIVGYFDCGI